MLEKLLTGAGLMKPGGAMPDKAKSMPGREKKMPVPETHYVNGHPMIPPYPEGMETALFAMGCFWGAERRFWQKDGVYLTSVGYAGGFTPNPTYDEVCTGLTGHTEAVLLVFDPASINYSELLRLFWESHDPTQGMRQGNDRGTQYRSAIGVFSARQKVLALASMLAYQERLTLAGLGAITTEILENPEFFYAEGYHQQYLAKNPSGYCGLGGTGIACSL